MSVRDCPSSICDLAFCFMVLLSIGISSSSRLLWSKTILGVGAVSVIPLIGVPTVAVYPPVIFVSNSVRFGIVGGIRRMVLKPYCSTASCILSLFLFQMSSIVSLKFGGTSMVCVVYKDVKDAISVSRFRVMSSWCSTVLVSGLV